MFTEVSLFLLESFVKLTELLKLYIILSHLLDVWLYYQCRWVIVLIKIKNTLIKFHISNNTFHFFVNIQYQYTNSLIMLLQCRILFAEMALGWRSTQIKSNNLHLYLILEVMDDLTLLVNFLNDSHKLKLAHLSLG